MLFLLGIALLCSFQLKQQIVLSALKEEKNLNQNIPIIRVCVCVFLCVYVCYLQERYRLQHQKQKQPVLKNPRAWCSASTRAFVSDDGWSLPGPALDTCIKSAFQQIHFPWLGGWIDGWVNGWIPSTSPTRKTNRKELVIKSNSYQYALYSISSLHFTHLYNEMYLSVYSQRD